MKSQRTINRANKWCKDFEKRKSWSTDYAGDYYTEEEWKAYLIIKSLLEE